MSLGSRRVISKDQDPPRLANTERCVTNIVETELIAGLEPNLELMHSGDEVQLPGIDLDQVVCLLSRLEVHRLLVNFLVDLALDLVDEVLSGRRQMGAQNDLLAGAEYLPWLTGQHVPRELDIRDGQVH